MLRIFSGLTLTQMGYLVDDTFSSTSGVNFKVLYRKHDYEKDLNVHKTQSFINYTVCGHPSAIMLTNYLMTLLGLFTTVWTYHLMNYTSYAVLHVLHVSRRSSLRSMLLNTVSWENTTSVIWPLWRTKWEWKFVIHLALFLPDTLTSFIL